MAKKKNITQENIIDWYTDDVLTENESSKTVFSFAKKHNFDENIFYEHFNSFEELEKAIFAIFCTKTVELLKSSEEFETYDAKNKLLSFYFTFFETLSVNRSYVFLRLKEDKNKLQSLKYLTGLRKEFLQFVKYLNIKQIDFKNDVINEFQGKGIYESLWIQLLMTIKFWLNDCSKGFEKTDLFIEKSIKVQFDLLDVERLESMFDFVKFLWKEKTM